MWWRIRNLIPMVCALVLACKPAGDVVGDDDTQQETGEDTDTDTQVTDEAEPAVDIEISGIEVNQAIGVLVWDNGQPVPESQRTSPLIAGRDATIRLLWDISETFESRDITAEVTLSSSAGEETWTNTRTIRSPSNRDQLNSTWNFTVDGGWIQKDTTLTVTLYEQPGQPGGATENITPANGELSLLPWDDTMRLKVKAFPCWMPCSESSSGAPPLSSDQKLSAENMLMNLYPIQELDLTWDNTPFRVNACSDTGALDAIQTRRANEGASPDTYYHCVFRQSYDSFLYGGFAWILSDEPGEPRVSFSVNWWGPDEEMLTNVAHEIGHNHGRNHPWTDSNWTPAAARETGCRSSWGLGIRPGPYPTEYWYPLLADPTRVVMPPTDDLTDCEYDENNTTTPPNTGDVMSYTFPHWVDPYTYNAFAERVRTVSGFSGGGSADTFNEKRTLFASFTDEGTLRWTWGYGALGAEDPLGTDRVTFETTRGQTIDIPIRPRVGSDGGIAGFSVPLPTEARVKTATGALWNGSIHGVFKGQTIEVRLQDLSLNP